MTKQLSVLITILSISLYSYGQSYVGFSGGYTNPIAYESKPENRDHLRISIREHKSGCYLSAHIKERLDRNFNIGLKSSISNLKLNYSHSDGGLGGRSGKNLEYNTYNLHLQVELEVKLIKNALYFNFGPELAIPVYSYKKVS